MCLFRYFRVIEPADSRESYACLFRGHSPLLQSRGHSPPRKSTILRQPPLLAAVQSKWSVLELPSRPAIRECNQGLELSVKALKKLCTRRAKSTPARHAETPEPECRFHILEIAACGKARRRASGARILTALGDRQQRLGAALDHLAIDRDLLDILVLGQVEHRL